MSFVVDRREVEVVPGFIVDHEEGLKETLSYRLKIDYERFDFGAVLDYIRDEDRTIFFFNNKLEIVSEDDETPGERIAWADTGYYDETGKRIYISFIKYPMSSTYLGHIAGDVKYLTKLLADKNIKYHNQIFNNLISVKKQLDEAIVNRKRQVIDETGNKISTNGIHQNKVVYMETCEKELTCITEDIYADLIFPSWKSIYGLDRYIKICGARIKQLINDGKNKYFVKNALGNVVINSGLMDHFGKDYLIMYRHFYKENEYDYYRAYRIISSKSIFVEEGFSKDDVATAICPISFFNDGEDVLSLTMDDIDVTPKNLTHIIEERRERFPDNTKEIPASTLAQRVMDSLQMSINILTRDRSYAKPVYSSKIGHIAWLLPLYIERNITEEPEMVALLDKAGDFYQVKTVMVNNDDIKDKITALSLYGKVW